MMDLLRILSDAFTLNTLGAWEIRLCVVALVGGLAWLGYDYRKERV